MKTHNYLYIILALTSLFVSCEKEVIITPTEPLFSDTDSQSMNEIEINYIETSNNSIYISWKRQKVITKYDLIINDEYTIRDIHDSDFMFSEYAYYTIYGLTPNTKQKITIRGFNKNNDTKNVSFEVYTRKDFVENVKQIVLDKYRYDYLSFTDCHVTPNNDFIIAASATMLGKELTVLFKLTKEYNIKWIQEINTQYINSFADFADGSLLVVHSLGVIKLNPLGCPIWEKIFVKNDLTLYAGTTEPDGTVYLTGTIFEYGPTRQIYTAKLDSYGTVVWEHYGEKKISKDMYWPSHIFINEKGSIIITGGTWNDGTAYPGEENLFFFEYSKDGAELSKKPYTIKQIPYFFSQLKYIEKLPDGSYVLFVNVADWDSGLLNKAVLCIEIDENFNFKKYEKRYFSAGGYFPRIISVYKRPDYTYSWLLHDDRGIILTNVNKYGEALSTIGLYNFPQGVISVSTQNDQTTYITKSGLIITLNHEGATHGYPKFFPDEFIRYN
ncbi:hypothetical protein D0T50_12755 [Bacteroides sp. 214]|uniref:hypothetical protein n=1 Tax=Bacteroides sp. 214 TaxID=2302935 RepID=UPI0013D2418B|nr:hypothetical protein [Bacteroides sp. 214]NDW13753.1 hypothetical protein [Bacteroides sp. 214]